MVETNIDQTEADVDSRMMRRCIGLSAEAVKGGELPFACVICDGDRVIVETVNEVRAQGDVTRHAELVAISNAQKVLNRKILAGCTLYTNVEPCPMCSFAIRETRIGRVVYALSSPKMGGVSKWNILRDSDLSAAMPEAFGPAPEIVSGLLWQEAAKVWRRWNPLAWHVIRRRGCFGPAPAEGAVERLRAAPGPAFAWLRSLLLLHGN